MTTAPLDEFSDITDFDTPANIKFLTLDLTEAAEIDQAVLTPLSDLDNRFATAAQGALADTATQPGDLAAVATTGNYSDLAGAPAIPANLGDLSDVSVPAPGDGEALVYNAGGGIWEAGSAGASLTVGTKKANILASSPAEAGTAQASDTKEFFLWDGSTWYVSPLELQAEDAAPDMGLQPTLVVNDRAGYSADYITDKTIHNSRILENVLTSEGAIRTTTGGTFEVYLNGVWNEIVINFRLREDSSGAYEFEHKPIGFTEWIEIMSGNSNSLGLNGLPTTQQYTASMGGYPVNLQVVGRSFD